MVEEAENRSIHPPMHPSALNAGVESPLPRREFLFYVAHAERMKRDSNGEEKMMDVLVVTHHKNK